MAFQHSAVLSLPAVLSVVGCGSNGTDASATPTDTLTQPYVATGDLDASTIHGSRGAEARRAPVADSDLPRDAPPRKDAGAPVCVLGETSSLPNVHIVVDATACVFTLAQARAGISIPYEVVIDESIEGFKPLQGYGYGPNVSGLEVTERIEGGGQHYCDCDHGLRPYSCPGPTCGPFALDKGIFPRTFAWSGVNWNGSSDSDQPFGAAFPPGDYVLTIATTPGSLQADGGGVPLNASAEFLIRLVQ